VVSGEIAGINLHSDFMIEQKKGAGKAFLKLDEVYDVPLLNINLVPNSLFAPKKCIFW
jgi:hypothetical protein